MKGMQIGAHSGENSIYTGRKTNNLANVLRYVCNTIPIHFR